jgi:transposase-like protein
MSKRRTHSPEFKARVAMEVISGRKTIQVSQWKRQLLDGASELFTRGVRPWRQLNWELQHDYNHPLS